MNLTAVKKTSSAEASPHASDTFMVLDALHKLSEPLTLLRVSLDLALEPMLAEHSREFMRDSLREAESALRMLHLIRETLEASLPQDETETVDLSGAVNSVLVNMPERTRFQHQLRGNVPVLANWKSLRVALACVMRACSKYARKESTIGLEVEFEIEHVVLRFGFTRSSGAEPKFSLFAPEEQSRDLVLARALAQSCGGDLTMQSSGKDFVVLMRLPLTLLEVSGVQ